MSINNLLGALSLQKVGVYHISRKSELAFVFPASLNGPGSACQDFGGNVAFSPQGVVCVCARVLSLPVSLVSLVCLIPVRSDLLKTDCSE